MPIAGDTVRIAGYPTGFPRCWRTSGRLPIGADTSVDRPLIPATAALHRVYVASLRSRRGLGVVARASELVRIDAEWLPTTPLDMPASAETALARVVQVFGGARLHHAYIVATIAAGEESIQRIASL